MEKWEQIRNLYFNGRMSQRQIARTLGIHRNTVKRAIGMRGGPQYERRVSYSSILDPFKDEINRMIESTDGNVFATVIYDKLTSREGSAEFPRYDGSYATLWRYVRPLKERLEPKEAYLRIETPPGFDAQCDWGKIDLVINGGSCRLSMFALTLS